MEQEDSSDDEVSKPANSHVNAESSGDTAGNTNNRSRKDSKNGKTSSCPHTYDRGFKGLFLASGGNVQALAVDVGIEV